MEILERGTRVKVGGKYGYIRQVVALDNWYAVEFDEDVPCGHNLGGILSPGSKRGLFLPPPVLEVVDAGARWGCLLDTTLSVPRAVTPKKTVTRTWFCAERPKL